METIDTISEKFKEDKWKAYAASLEAALDVAHKKIKDLEAQLQIREKTPEQIICELEIEKLRATSALRSLTLEETKRFDLLVKNLLLAKEANNVPKKESSGPNITISEAALIAIASVPEADGTE